MKSWAAKYKDAGLVVIGVHTPEFSFEQEPVNVENAVRDLNLPIRSRSTATMGFGRRSTTNTGRRNTSSMGKDEFVITTSGKANMSRSSVSSSSF